ncbi:MAG: YfiR family protein [Burkholderiales bacterium]|nr:YfiR family protein [Burkholderiales bacterium]
MPTGHRMLRLLLLLVTLTWAGSTHAGSTEISAQIKAAYLYKFATYVEWPVSSYEQNNTTLIIGIVGADEIADSLNQIKSSPSAPWHSIEVRVIKPGESLAGIHILFIGHGELERIKRILEQTLSLPILTVTDTNGALSIGSAINFLNIDDHIRFEVSLIQAERHRLKISARLLAVAQKIENGKP